MKTSILVLFSCWTATALFLSLLPLSDEISNFYLQPLLLLVYGGYLLLASTLVYPIMRRIIGMEKVHFLSYCGFSLVLFLLLYWYGINFSHENMVVAGIFTANLLFGATLIGAGLSSAVKRAGELVPVCLTAATADLMSVYKGPTKHMIEDITAYYEKGMEGIPPFIDFIVVKIGVPGFVKPVPLFGVTDWVLMVLLSTALLRLGKSDNILGKMGWRQTIVYLPVTALALYVGLITANLAGTFIPAMVFIAGIFLLYLVICIRVHQQLEKGDIVLCLVFPVLVAGVIFLYSK